MEINTYLAVGEIKKKLREKTQERAEVLGCSSSFIKVMYSPPATYVDIRPNIQCSYTYCIYKHMLQMCLYARQKKERERMCSDQQIIHSVLCVGPRGDVQCVILRALLRRLARLYICHLRSIREA